MGVRFQEIIAKSYKIGDTFLRNSDHVVTITGFIKTPCTGCSFENIRYKCDGTRLIIDNNLRVCAFQVDGSEFAQRVLATNERW